MRRLLVTRTVERLTWRRIVVYSLLLTLVLEVVTAVFRFGFRLKAAEVTAVTIGYFTWGIRLHHGYPGIVCAAIAAALWRRFPAAARWVLVLGIGLFLSDMMHHFVVLWLVKGSPEFDFLYPR